MKVFHEAREMTSEALICLWHSAFLDNSMSGKIFKQLGVFSQYTYFYVHYLMKN